MNFTLRSRRSLKPFAMFALALGVMTFATVGPATGPAHAQTYGEAAAQYARDHLVGVPYAYGKRSVTGFDCSGGVYLAWAAAKPGLVGSGTSKSQYSGTGDKIYVGTGTTLSNGSLLPGDLLFWGTGASAASIYHVAIYLGSGQILQTTDPDGTASWVGSINDNKSTRVAYALRPLAGSPATPTPPPTTTQLPIAASGNWWGAAHWTRLGKAIGLASVSDAFGRSPWDELNGAYSASSKSLQNYLNAQDGGVTANITADGYWGPTTTEKLRAVIDYKCGQTKLGIYGAIDGKGAYNTTFQFNQDEAEALAKCLNSNKF